MGLVRKMEKDFLSEPIVTGQWAMVLKEGRFRFGIMKTFFIMRVVRHRNRLHREVWMLSPWKCSRPGWMGL